jgi:NlpC/P60 family/Bacterial dipeptidyl-peptidase Sh3 domain
MQYRTKANLNLYDGPELTGLVTQAAAGRFLEITTPSPHPAIPAPLAVRLCADGYPGWLAAADLANLAEAALPYQAPVVSEEEIRDRLPQVIAFTHAALAVPNAYLWGGTVAPNYDCSGLMQAAFLSVGIQLPRDAYQQEAFVQPIALADCQPGDLIFFGTPVKATHVALYLGNNQYIHSSGQDQGRNGIGIDVLSPDGDAVSRAYYAQLRGAGRVVASYQPI